MDLLYINPTRPHILYRSERQGNKAVEQRTSLYQLARIRFVGFGGRGSRTIGRCMHQQYLLPRTGMTAEIDLKVYRRSSKSFSPGSVTETGVELPLPQSRPCDVNPSLCPIFSDHPGSDVFSVSLSFGKASGNQSANHRDQACTTS